MIIKQDKEGLISFLLDAIQKAIEPSCIKRSWLERHIRPVLEDFFKSHSL